jgi:nucleoside-diphosphate-sugar epimerase
MAIRVLLTGASGFVGRHCLAALAHSDCELHALARSAPVPEAGRAVWHHLDLADRAATQALLAEVRPTHLLHAAWFVTPGQFWTSPENVDWVARSALLVRDFQAAGGRRVLGVGTCAEYAPSAEDCREGVTPLVPTTLYGSAKHATREILEAYCRQAGLSFSWARLFMMYGPYEDGRRLVASVIDALLAGRPIELGDGLIRRDLMAGADIGAALARLMLSGVEGAINIASGEQVTLRHAIETLGDLMGRRDLLHFGVRPRPAHDPERLTGDLTRQHAELGWRPRFDLRAGLADAIAWRRDRQPRQP